MNKEFMVKMLQAKQLEYEALKEIMPECMVKRIDKVGDELLEIAKECFMTSCGSTGESKSSSEKASKSKVNKITIE